MVECILNFLKRQLFEIVSKWQELTYKVINKLIGDQLTTTITCKKATCI